MLDSRQLWLLILFCAVYISWGLTDSIQAPFYPIEAELKGATIGQYGGVFGIIHLAIFFSGPIFGNYMHELGTKNVYTFGVISTAICAILFGFLDRIDNTHAFLVSSYLIRMMEGVAEAASWSAVFSMLLVMFPHNVATVYSFTEASFSFSEMIGPTLGAMLYKIGGFMLPFEICGGLCLITGLVTLFVIPNHITAPSECESSPESVVPADSILHESCRSSSSTRASRRLPQAKNTSHLKSVLTNVEVLLALSGTVYAASVQGLLEACLELHLEQFNLSITKIGLTFLGLSMPYFLASPMWGYCCDHLFPPERVQLCGTTTIILGFLLVGPAPYLPIESEYSVLVIGLALLGIGTAAGLVASFAGAQRAALRGNSEIEHLHSAISGVWTASFALGNFLGPTLGSLLFAAFDFRMATMFFQGVGIALSLIDFARVVRGSDDNLRMKRGVGQKLDLYEQLV